MANNQIRFTEDHEWVRMDGDVALIGISEYAAEELGEIVYLDLIDQGESLEKTQEFGSVESVKTVSGLFSPITGEVVDVNTRLLDKPGGINQSPHEHGWLIKIKPEKLQEIEDLMSENQYKLFLEENT